MIAALLLFAFGLGQSQPSTPSAITQNQSGTSSSGTQVDPEISSKLLQVRRICVESFGDDVISKQLQAMVIDALVQSKRFIVTENKDKADAVLKGIGLEKTSQELHAIGEETNVGVASGGERRGNGGFLAQHMGTSDSQASTETIDDARLAVRLVSSDGDVIWTTTKESHGGKYMGASADVADQIVKQLLRDLDRPEPAPKQ